jgi:D-arginine dehydrogenase
VKGSDALRKEFDFLVIGGGIGGISVGYELAAHGRVCVLEREAHLAYHSTGRSAAVSLEMYGNAVIRSLTRASRSFYLRPPAEFCGAPLVMPRGALFLAEADNQQELRSHFNSVRSLVETVLWLEPRALHELLPILTPGRWVAGVYEPGALDLDVHEIHQAYMRGLRARDGTIFTAAEVVSLARHNQRWEAGTPNGILVAPVVVNAAGAWADQLVALAGGRALGLRALRRTAILIESSADPSRWPYVGDIRETFYFKPDAGRLLVSPCDETPMPPCDVTADAEDIAVAAERMAQATTLSVNRIVSKWAGLRSFVADRTPVVGPDPQLEGFFWLAAQGGYGIQAAPALAQLCSALVLAEPVPTELARLGLQPASLSPARDLPKTP